LATPLPARPHSSRHYAGDPRQVDVGSVAAVAASCGGCGQIEELADLDPGVGLDPKGGDGRGRVAWPCQMEPGVS
jgi:hypothetical protein